MTELDFDELDKAVNSLMAEDGKPADETTTSAVASSSSVDQTVAAAPAPNLTSSAPTESAVVPSPAVRRRGQFMDVIHPSSNMRQAPAQVSRAATDVTPPSVEEAVSVDDTSVTEAPVDAPVVTPKPADAQTVTPEVSPVEDDITPASEAVPPAPDHSVETTDPTPAEEVAPLTSPFLPDAKVDKRPLGSPVSLTDTPSEMAETSIEETADTSDDAQEQSDAAVMPDPVPLPDELKEDVVAVEADEDKHTEAVEADIATASSEPAEMTSVEESPVADMQPPAGGDIPQQYQEQPSTGDQTNGAIFDTNTYHQPLDAHPPKKKSSVLTAILWIIALLILGATAGAAWFYFTTQ